MSITLATTWYPRGELTRFKRLLPSLMEQYQGIVVSFIPGIDLDLSQEFICAASASHPGLVFYENQDQRRGRFMALSKSLDTGADFIHYADMDRLLRWVETRPEEWRRMLAQIEQFDCVIFGRTEAATRTHPQSLITTEKLSNRVVANFLNAEMDVSAGSKSFSRSAARYLVEHARMDNSIGSDAEWPILLKQAGFKLNYLLVDGLDYESGDQFRPQAATADEQAQAALQYDADPMHWSRRIEIAEQIIQTALEVSQLKSRGAIMENSTQSEFDVEAVFDVDDYLYFYAESLTDERTDAEVSALVSLLQLNTPMEILDLACGFGRHANRLAVLGHSMTGVDLTPGFLEIARQEAKVRKVEVNYQLGDMRNISFAEKFDRVLLLFTSFGYFTDEQNLQVLINARQALKPGGLLIFDSLNRDALLKGMRPYNVVEKEGNLMIDRLRFDGLQGKYYNQRIVIRDGIRKDKPYFVRLYNPNEIKMMLAQAGLELHQTYAGWEGMEFTSDAYRLVVIARKPE
jgi:SAM-dependent methyltransferase